MVRIQLENGYLEVKDGVKLPLNFGVADIRDISKRSGTFSKTIKLVGTDNNNALLNQYYDVNIQAGTFNIDVLTKCSILENGIPIIEDATLQLVSVDKVQHDNGHDEKVEYSVLVKDIQANFFTKINNQELTDLDFTDLNHTFNSTNIVASHTHTVTDGYVYPICANPASVYAISTLRPAIYTKLYWDRIHSTNGFSYEWADMTADKFDLTVIPYNGDFPEVDLESYLVDIAKTTPFIPTLNQTIDTWTENQDDENIFNPTTGVYSVPFYVKSGLTAYQCWRAQGRAINWALSIFLEQYCAAFRRLDIFDLKFKLRRASLPFRKSFNFGNNIMAGQFFAFVLTGPNTGYDIFHKADEPN